MYRRAHQRIPPRIPVPPQRQTALKSQTDHHRQRELFHFPSPGQNCGLRVIVPKLYTHHHCAAFARFCGTLTQVRVPERGLERWRVRSHCGVCRVCAANLRCRMGAPSSTLHRELDLGTTCSQQLVGSSSPPPPASSLHPRAHSCASDLNPWRAEDPSQLVSRATLNGRLALFPNPRLGLWRDEPVPHVVEDLTSCLGG